MEKAPCYHLVGEAEEDIVVDAVAIGRGNIRLHHKRTRADKQTMLSHIVLGDDFIVSQEADGTFRSVKVILSWIT